MGGLPTVKIKSETPSLLPIIAERSWSITSWFMSNRLVFVAPVPAHQSAVQERRSTPEESAVFLPSAKDLCAHSNCLDTAQPYAPSSCANNVPACSLPLTRRGSLKPRLGGQSNIRRS